MSDDIADKDKSTPKSRTFNILDLPSASGFASEELVRLSERSICLATKLKTTTDEVERALLERQLFVLLGEAAGLLKVVRHEFSNVYSALQLDDDGNPMWGQAFRFDDLMCHTR